MEPFTAALHLSSVLYLVIMTGLLAPTEYNDILLSAAGLSLLYEMDWPMVY